MSTVAAERVRVKQCLLCREAEFETLSRRDRHGQPLESVVCRHCGLVSHAEIPSAADLEKYYSARYRRDYNGEATPSSYRVVREWRRAAKLLRRVGPRVPPGGSVFEVGSGIGCAVKQFELAGFQSAGIEPGREFQGFSRDRLRADVQLGLLDDVSRRPAHDLVLLVHVLEHVRDPLAALEHIHQMLRSGGLLYLEVPNFGMPHAAPKRIFHFAHIYNFTRYTLTALAAAAGFEPVETLSRPDKKDLMILFRATAARHREIDPRGYEAAVGPYRALSRWRYYLRRKYLAGRVRTIGRQLGERATAKRQMRRILEQCNGAGGPRAAAGSAARAA